MIDIHERVMAFGIRALQVFRRLQKNRDEASRIVGRQFSRAALSVGANMTEADAAESKADFVHKCSIAQKEAREALYWLQFMVRSTMLQPQQIAAIADEARQIAAIITAIARNAKQRTSA